MARTSAFRKASQTEAVSFNMTPMIDCTFQLIIFFILASQVANKAYAQHVTVPRPEGSQAVPQQVMPVPKVTINVVSQDAENRTPDDPLDDATAGFYEVNGVRYDVGDVEGLVKLIQEKKAEALAMKLLTEKGEGSEFYLEVRADKRINWEDVAPVIRAGVSAGIRKMNITALTEQK